MIEASSEEVMDVVPIFLSTVTPGKFPTCWLSPVSVLNSELFPLFGFPTKAIWIMLLFTMVQPAKVSSEPLTGLRFGKDSLPFMNIQLTRFIKWQHIGYVGGKAVSNVFF